MKEIELRGKPYEIGFAFGEDTKHYIKSFIQGVCNTIKLSLSPQDLYKGEKKVEKFEKLLSTKYPEIAGELKGIADGSGTGYDETLWYNSYEEIFFEKLSASFRCSNLAFLDSEDGPIIAKTNDISFYLLPNFRIMRIKPQSGYELLQIGTVSTYMTSSGLNCHGLAYAGTGLFVKGENENGVPHTFLQRMVLQNCKNVKEAIQYVSENDLMKVGMHMSFIDKEGNGAIVGKMPKAMYVLHPDKNNTMYCTNHILDERYSEYMEDFPLLLENSKNRYKNLARLSVCKNRNLRSLQEIFRDHSDPGAICQHGNIGMHTVLAYVIQVNEGKFHLSEGYPCLNEFQVFSLQS